MKHPSIIVLTLAALALLSSCGLVESTARTTKSVLGIHDTAPPRSMMAMPENEWQATWEGERDALLRELRFGKEGQ